MAETLRYDVLGKGDASDLAKVAAALEALTAKLTKLDRTKAEPTVELDTRKAEKALGAFAADMKKRLTAAVKALPEIELDADSSDADRAIARIRAALADLSEQRIGVDIDAADAEARMRLLQAELAELSESGDLRIRVDAGQAVAALGRVREQIQDTDREVGAFARSLQGQVAAAIRSLPDIEIDTDSSDIQREVAAIRAELVALGDQRIGIDIDASSAQAAVARLQARLAALGDTELDVAMRADVAGALSKLAAAEAAVDRLDGKTARLEFEDRGLADAVIRVAALGRALQTIVLPAAAVAAAPTLASIGAAAVAAAGAVGLIPAVGGAAALSIGTLAVATRGWADAMDALDDPAAFAEAVERLSPAAREAAEAVRSLKPAWDSMQLQVQQRLFAETGQRIQELGVRYLPVLRDSMTRVADSFNVAGRDVTTFLLSARGTRDVTAIFDGLTATVSNLTRETGGPLARALADVGVVGSRVLADLTSGAGDAAVRFADFVAEARRTGELESWIRGGVEQLQQLGRIGGDVGGILGSIFEAADQAGAGFFDTLERITSAVDDFFDSARGQEALLAFFTEIRSTVDAAAPGVRALALAVVDVVQSLSRTGTLTAAAEAFTAIAEAAAPLVRFLGELAAAVLPPLLSALGGVAPLLVPIAAGIAAVVLAGKGIAAMQAAWLGLATAVGRVNSVVRGSGAQWVTVASSTDRAAAAGSRFSGVLTKVGNALPVVGLAALGLAAYFESIEPSSAALERALLAGGDAAEKAARQFDVNQEAAAALAPSIFGLSGFYRAFADDSDDVRRRVEEQTAALPPLERAQLRVAQAQNAYLDAVARSGSTSDEARTAAERYREALAGLERQERLLIEASTTREQRLAESIAASQAAASADLQRQSAMLDVERAGQALNETLAEYGAVSLEGREASIQYQGALQQLAAAQEAYAAEAFAGLDAETRKVAAQEAGIQALLSYAAVAEGPARDAALKQVAALDDTALAAISASNEMSGLATTTLTLPGGRTITVLVDGADLAEVAVGRVSRRIQEIPREIVVRMGLDGSPAETSAAAAARAALDRAQGILDGDPATMPVDADTGPALAGIAAATAVGNASASTGTHNANNSPALAAINAARAVGMSAASTAAHNANTAPAIGAINGARAWGNAANSQSTHTVIANTAAARSAIAGLRVGTSSTHTVYVRTVGGGAGVGASLGRAAGAYAIPAAYASGGMREMSAARAEIVPPRQPRLIGDRMEGDEAFIPINRSPRSQAILATAAGRMGWALAPLPMASGGMVRLGDVSASRWKQLKAQGWRGRAGDRMEALYAPSSGGRGGGSLGSLRVSVRRMHAGGVLSGPGGLVADAVRSAAMGGRPGWRTGGGLNLGELLGELRGMRATLRDLLGDATLAAEIRGQTRALVAALRTADGAHSASQRGLVAAEMGWR